MKRFLGMVAALAVGLTLAACQTMGGADWETLIDGEKGLENFDRVGDANWRAESGGIVADKGKGGHLVSKKSYKDFVIRAEFWAVTETQSGIFIRIGDRNKVGTAVAYEVNIYDTRPGQEYATGSIVNVASVPVPIIYKAGGEKGATKLNVMEITAKGDDMTVVFNGVVSAHARHGQFKEGPFSLQFGNRDKLPGGPIKWRKVEIRPI